MFLTVVFLSYQDTLLPIRCKGTLGSSDILELFRRSKALERPVKMDPEVFFESYFLIKYRTVSSNFHDCPFAISIVLK